MTPCLAWQAGFAWSVPDICSESDSVDFTVFAGRSGQSRCYRAVPLRAPLSSFLHGTFPQFGRI